MKQQKQNKKQRPIESDPEAAVICACSHPLWPQAIEQAKVLLTPDDFQDPDYKLLFETMVGLSNDGQRVDLVTIAKSLEYSPMRVIHRLVETVTLTAIPSTIPMYAEILRDNRGQLKVQAIADDAGLSAQEKIAKIQELRISADSQAGTLFDAAGCQAIVQAFESNEGKTYFKSGLDPLDKIIVGFQPRTVTAIQGLYKSGKTKFLIQIMAEAIKQGYGVGFLSLEMPMQRVRNWFMSHLCSVDSLFFNNPRHHRWNVTRVEYQDRIAREMGWLQSLRIYVSDVRRPSVDVVIQQIQDWAKKDVRLVGLDYFERMDTGVDWKDEGIVTSKLADAAAANDIALIYVDQLNKEAERGTTTSWAYSRGSTARNADADLILQMRNRSRQQRKGEADKMAAMEISIMGREVPSGIQIPVMANLAIGKFTGRDADDPLEYRRGQKI